MDGLSEYLKSVKPSKDQEPQSISPRPQEGEKRLKFVSSSAVIESKNSKDTDEEKKVVIMEDLLPSERLTLYDQLCQNRKKEEDELAARRKLMYGVRPMDDDEYKDYEQMEIARRERERQRKEKQDYEERQFKSIQQEMMLAETGVDDEAQHLSFGSKAVTSITSKSPKKGRKLVLKKKETTEKKEKKDQKGKKDVKELSSGRGLSHLLSLDD